MKIEDGRSDGSFLGDLLELERRHFSYLIWVGFGTGLLEAGPPNQCRPRGCGLLSWTRQPVASKDRSIKRLSTEHRCRSLITFPDAV